MFLIVRLLSVLKLNLIRSLIDEFRSDGKKGLKILNMWLSSSFLKCISFNYFPFFLQISFIALKIKKLFLHITSRFHFFPTKSMYLYNEHFEIVRRIFVLKIIRNVTVIILISTSISLLYRSILVISDFNIWHTVIFIRLV